MGRKKKTAKRKQSAPTLGITAMSALRERLTPELLSGLRSIGAAVVLLSLIAGAIYGLERIKGQVYARPELNQPLRVVLVDVPERLQDKRWTSRIVNRIEIPENAPRHDRSTLENIVQQMRDSGWVSKECTAAIGTDGTIPLKCEYREPVAMMRAEDGFVAVAHDHTDGRYYVLPETYSVESIDGRGWLRIYGVDLASIPPVNQPLDEGFEDAAAGALLANTLIHQRYASSIRSIDVRNYQGRIDRTECHVYLTTDTGRRIKWGSAIGDELEEENVTQKLENLGKYLQQRSAAGTRTSLVDVSIHPDAVIEHRVNDIDTHDVRTADATRPRR